jgi:hypothetical protein
MGGKLSRLILLTATRFRARVLKRCYVPTGPCRVGVVPASHNLRLRDVEESLPERIKC